ncbi:MAG: sigma-70 family RNA polymerase sigma factor, partial [Planctomycetales bacterium]|nr:sigma-70 family RNA polymerase sigma factor [Planctomycetales bacterium]
TGNGEACDELWQEFAMRLIQGDFHKADPAKGRFRSYLKTVLVRMSHRHREQAARRATVNLELSPVEPVAEHDQPSFDLQWREHLIDRAWHALRDARPPYETLLRLRTEQPDASSQQLAAAMKDRHGVDWTAETLRQTLRRARQRFGELLLDEVAHSIDPVTRDTMEEELAALELLSYCRPWLDRWMAST